MSISAANSAGLPNVSLCHCAWANQSLISRKLANHCCRCFRGDASSSRTAICLGFREPNEDENFALKRVCRYVSRLMLGHRFGTQEYLDASSPRSQQMREYLERTGRTGKEAAEIAAHSTRDRKEIHSPAEVMAAHRKLAADFGHQADAVVRAARERSQHQEKPLNPLDRVRESLTFSRDKNFEREAVVDERALIRDGLRRGMGEITYTQVRANLDARLASGEFQIVERPQTVPSRQFTTAKTIQAEHEILLGCVRG